MGDLDERRRKGREKMQKWRAANPERAKEASRKSSKKWRQENPERYKELRQKSYTKNKDKVAARNSQWQKDNKDHVNEYHRDTYHKYQRQILGHQMGVRESYKLNVLIHYSSTDPPQCADPYETHKKSGSPFTTYDALHLDHISNNGKEDRARGLSGLALHRYLIKHDFPEGYQVLCANCNHLKEVLRQEAERLNTRASINSKKYRERVKYIVIAYYSRGGMKCASPYHIHSENDPYLTDIRVLTIDHIADDGNIHRKKIGHNSGTHLYKWLIKNKLPEGYQVLCCSCQWIKELHRRKALVGTGSPHKTFK